MQTRRRFLLALGLLSTSLAAGCHATTARSERLVLPEFSPSELENKRFFVAPYAAKDMDPLSTIPLEPEVLGEIMQHMGEPAPIVAAMLSFYMTAADEANVVFGEQGTRATVVHLPRPHWGAYFSDARRFVSVSVDGETRFQVPRRQTLQEFGADADFALVLTSLGYRLAVSTTTDRTGGPRGTTTRTTSRTIDGTGKFLVWDYRRGRAIASGELTAESNTGRHPDEESWLRLARATMREILVKSPFR